MKFGDHTPSVQMPKHKNSIIVAARVINWVLGVGAPLMISENGLWHMEGRRTQHWITVAAAHIRFFWCLFFVMSEDKFSYPLSPSSHCLFSFSHTRAGPDCRCGGGGQGDKGEGKVIFFESKNVESLSAFFSGCCSEAAGWRTPPAAPNRNRERDALIKNPMSALAHKRTTQALIPTPCWWKSIQFKVLNKTLLQEG